MARSTITQFKRVGRPRSGRLFLCTKAAEAKLPPRYDYYMEKRRAPGAVVLSVSEDTPVPFPGGLIPGNRPTQSQTVTPAPSPSDISKYPTAVFVGAVLFFAMGLGVTAFNSVKGSHSVAAPVVVVDSAEPELMEELTYGTRLSFTEPNFFNEAKQAFLESNETFIEADLDTMELRLYSAGEAVFEAPILAKGREGSWWETPAGLYGIESKKVNHFSSFGQVWQPWSMVFQGNFFIHGWPYYPDGTEVPEGYSGGCIRLSTEDAEALYALTPLGTSVLVHERDFEPDGFVYEPKVPDVTSTHYLIADIKSNTVLASSDLDTVVPIASVTKLMTALVAAEYINLDTEVRIAPERYVDSLIPRLEGKRRASMYSLLELLLIESSNEAAEVIAAEVGRDRFVRLMNEKAESLGLSNTTFTDPSGLDSTNVSSLRDLLHLARYIYNNRSFILDITAEANLSTLYDAGDFGELENFNEIEDIDSFIGGKVGETMAAGQTSLSLHELNIKDSERVIAIIILDSESRSEDVTTLITYVEERF